MIRLLTAATLVSLSTTAAFAADPEVTPETATQITELLAGMNCQMDTDDIEVTKEGGYDLDDVMCEGGKQFDIELDANLKEVSRRAE